MLHLHRRDLLRAGGAFFLSRSNRTKIATVITEYRQNSHADVLAGRLIKGYEYDGKPHTPDVEVISMYTDQTPKNDMSRGLAAQYGFKLCPTIREALLMGGARLAVGGVVLIGEHGNYPWNEKEQHLYPRYELYKQIIDVFHETGQTVPVFTDKHLSYDWDKAKWMYDQSRAMHFPLMAGSSVPLAWRRPAVELDYGARVPYAVGAFYGGKDAYGFHSLEALQSIVERRQGGETGVAAVQCLDGAEVWKWTDANPWAGKLLDLAVARSENNVGGSMREHVKNPAVFLVEYRSGLRAALYMLDGQIQAFSVACTVEGRKEPLSTEFWLQPKRWYGHFGNLAHYVEQFVVSGREPYPVERTLLTSGTLAALMDSSWRKGKRLETPHLAIRYRSPKQSFQATVAVPTPEES
ncbi:MAG: hypothetical protein NTY38_29045 [Acidobacteria bacterium]|nr:hypothetical protein [Acidobacteriota bacterium]